MNVSRRQLLMSIAAALPLRAANAGRRIQIGMMLRSFSDELFHFLKQIGVNWFAVPSLALQADPPRWLVPPAGRTEVGTISRFVCCRQLASESGA